MSAPGDALGYSNPYQPLPPRVGPAGYWVAAGVVLVGVIAAVVWVVIGLRSMSRDVESFPRSALPATLAVQVTEPGGQVIYYEGGGATDASLRLLVLGPDGQQVAVRPYGGSLDYNIGGHSGHALATFDADRPGQFTVNAEANRPGGAIAVSKSMAGAIVRTVVGPLAIVVTTVVVGLVLVIMTSVRRRRFRTHGAAWPAQPPPAAPVS